MSKPTKKQRIIEAAIRLWQTSHNINKISLADIAREAEVSPTTIYNQFNNREGLIREVIKSLTDKLVAAQWEIIRSEMPFPVKIQKILNTKISIMDGLQTALLEKFSEDTIASRYLDKVYQTQSRPMMQALIQEGKQKGFIHPDISEEAVILYLDILKAGGLACSSKLRSFLEDTESMNGLLRLIYFGMFMKEFDFKTYRENGKGNAWNNSPSQ